MTQAGPVKFWELNYIEAPFSDSQLIDGDRIFWISAPGVYKYVGLLGLLDRTARPIKVEIKVPRDFLTKVVVRGTFCRDEIVFLSTRRVRRGLSNASAAPISHYEHAQRSPSQNASAFLFRFVTAA